MFFLAEELEIREVLENYVFRWRKQKPLTTGTDLKKLGLKPGPHYRKILERLRYAWIDGEIQSRKQENEELNRLLKKYSGVPIPEENT